MLDAFSTALVTALGTFKTGAEDAVGDNLVVILPFTLGLIAIFVVWRVVKRFANAK